RSRRGLAREAVELLEELRDRELDASVRRLDSREAVRPLIHGEHDAARTREDRVEERFGRLGRVAAEAGAGERRPLTLRRDVTDGPQARTLREPFGKQIADRSVEDDRRDLEEARLLAEELEELRAERRPALEPGGAQRRGGVVRQRAERIDKAGVQL